MRKFWPQYPMQNPLMEKFEREIIKEIKEKSKNTTVESILDEALKIKRGMDDAKKY